MMNPQPPTPPRASTRTHRKNSRRQEELELLQAINDKLDYLLLLHPDEEMRFPHHEHYLETHLTPE